MVAAVVPVVIADIFTKELPGAVAALVGFTGLFGGAVGIALLLADALT